MYEEVAEPLILQCIKCMKNRNIYLHVKLPEIFVGISRYRTGSIMAKFAFFQGCFFFWKDELGNDPQGNDADL